MWPLHQNGRKKVPVRDKACRERRRRRRTCLRSSASVVAILAITVLNIIKGRRTRRRNMIKW